jgi:hypothetical protein
MKLKQLSLLIGSLFLVCLLAGCGEKRQNLLRNASMEKGSDLPDNWETWAHIRELSTFSLEEGNAKDGKKCVVIYSPSDNDARFNQSFNVTKGACYKISGWVKTKDVENGRGANLSIFGINLSSDASFFGTNTDWEYQEFYLMVNMDVSRVTLSLGLGGYGGMSKGYAYFDDIRVQRVADPSPTVQVHQLGDANALAEASRAAANKLNLLKPLQALMSDYRAGDFVMLGAMGFSMVFALLILLFKKEPDKQAGCSGARSEAEQAGQPTPLLQSEPRVDQSDLPTDLSEPSTPENKFSGPEDASAASTETEISE